LEARGKGRDLGAVSHRFGEKEKATPVATIALARYFCCYRDIFLQERDKPVQK
jgi:hypothetical protein